MVARKLSSRSGKKGDLFLALFLLVLQSGSVLRTQKKRERRKGDKSTNCRGRGQHWDISRSRDLYGNSHSSLQGCPSQAFTLRHKGQTAGGQWGALGSPALAPRAANREDFPRLSSCPSPASPQVLATALTSREHLTRQEGYICSRSDSP